MDSHRYLWPLASISGMNMLAYGFNLLLISVDIYLVCTHAPCGITTHFYRLLLSGWIEWSGLSSSCPPGLEGGAWSHGWGGRGPCCRSQSWCWCSSWAELGACPRPPHYQTSSDRLQPTFLCTRESETQTLLTDGLVLNLSALHYWSDTNKNNISCLLIMLFLYSVKRPITTSHITASPVSTAQRTRSHFPVNWNSLQDVLWFLIKRKQRTMNTEIKCFHHIVSFISFKHNRSLIIKNNKNGWKISTNKKRKL